MAGTRDLLAEDRPEFQQVLDEALRMELTGGDSHNALRREQLRSMALASTTLISAAAATEYDHYVRVREQALGRRSADLRSASIFAPERSAGGAVAAVTALAPILCATAALLFLLVGYGLKVVNPEQALAGPLVTTGWLLALVTGAAVVLAAVSSLALTWRERRQQALTGDGGASPPDEVERAREAWLRALLVYGVQPFLREALAAAPPAHDGHASGTPAPRSPSIPKLGYFRPDFTSRDSTRPTFTSPDFTSPDFGGPDFGPAARPPTPPSSEPADDRFPEEPEPRTMTVELVEQAPPGVEVPLHVQINRCADEKTRGVLLQAFDVPKSGARLLITVHAPGLIALGDLQQELTVRPGEDSPVLTFGLRTAQTGLRTVTVRAFHGGSFLGELRTQVSVQPGTPARGGPPRDVPLATVAFDPGEVTLQVLRGADGAYSFQLISETCYAPEAFRLLAGDPRQTVERIYDELRRMATAAGPSAEAGAAGKRLRNLGVELWASAVPDAVRRQFWDEADRISSMTILGEHDLVPWELLYPLDGRREGPGFLSEWLPVIRRAYGQERVRELSLPSMAFVVPPGSPPEAHREVEAVRRVLGERVADGGVLADRAAVSSLVEDGFAGLLHFACHNSFNGGGSSVTMGDGRFDPIDLSYATHSGALRDARPLVFFNACRSAGEIDWFSSSLGWGSQFLRSGAGAFVGTLWPVRSDAALAFAEVFYDQLVGHGQNLSQASLQARKAVRKHDGDPTCLAYAVYGSPAARVVTPNA